MRSGLADLVFLACLTMFVLINIDHRHNPDLRGGRTSLTIPYKEESIGSKVFEARMTAFKVIRKSNDDSTLLFDARF